jgi:hypothetical protein
MSKQISQDGKSFSVNLNSEEFKSVRMPVCYVSFLSKGEEMDNPKTTRLGDIQFEIDVDAVSYYCDEKGLDVSNRIVWKQKEFPVNDVVFSPCLLDVDGDGVVSKEDIEAVYGKPNTPVKFDIDGDGIVTEADRLLANEYVGTICAGTEDNDVVLYDGVYDHIPDMKWGYSVNRLLRGGHSTRPLFRVYMAVNYFTNHDFSAPNAAPARGYRFAQDRGGSSFIKEPLLKKFYTTDSLNVEAGEMLVKDMYWTGSEDNLKSDIQEFYALGKQMQEANGITPDEEFYSRADTKFILSSVRVSAVYDQSGNDKHAYSRFYFSSGNTVTTLFDGQMIMAMGELITNDDGRLSLSGYGYSKDNPNPFGIAEGTGTLSRGAMSFIAATGDENWDTAYEYAPLSDPNEPVYMYTVKDYTAKKTTAPFEPFYDGPHDAIDNLQLIADHYGFNSFQDIFDGDTGRLKTEFIEQIPESSHLFQYNRAIANASGLEKMGLNTNGGRVYSEFSGNSIQINSTGYPYYMEYRPVEDPHPGWSHGVRYEDFVTSDGYGDAAQVESGRTLGVKDIYTRLMGVAAPADGNYNRRVGFNKYVDDQTIVTSLRYHDDNFVSGENPRMDFRLNNKRHIDWGPGDGSLNNRPAMLAPKALSVNGPGNEFYEMVAFKYHDEESYESVMSDANAYFGTTPLANASHAPTPES